MTEVKVSDEEYQNLAEAYRQYKNYVDGGIDLYCGLLSKAATNGLKSGVAHDALLQFQAYAVNMKGQAGAILDFAIRYCNDYVAEIDNLDKDVY
jgi:hypothetical protein